MHRLLSCMALVLVVWPALGAGGPPYPLGPVSQLARYDEGELWNEVFTTQIERGFKLHATVAAPGRPNWFGRQEFAGFLTLQTPQGPLFERFARPTEGTRTLICDRDHVIVAKEAEGWRQTVEVCRAYPFVWLSSQTPPDAGNAVTWRLMGYGWAEQAPPETCEFLPFGRETPARVALSTEAEDAVPAGMQIGGPLVVLRFSDEPFALALVFPRSPGVVRAAEDGVEIGITSGEGPDFALAIVPAELGGDDLLRLMPLAFSRPTRQGMSFELQEGTPVVTYATGAEAIGNEWGIEPARVTCLPPTLAMHAPEGALTVDTLQGPISVCPGAQLRVSLAPVADMEEVGPPLGEMPEAWRQRLGSYATEMVDRLRWCGGFSPSEGRPFYDGLTCSGLMTAYPYLPAAMQERVAEAVRRTLDLWWEHMCLDGETGIWYFPEPVPFRPVIDYPEITATLLWPTVQYAALVAPEYPRAIAAQIRNLGATLPLAYDWTGAAYAYPGPEFTHIIAESVMGGFVGCCAMSRLADMAGEAELSAQYAARAALAREAMALLRWREEFGEKGIVSELRRGEIKTGIEAAWDYTMHTWFSYVPALQLPEEDRYGLWRSLEQARWWTYAERSRQRCYDFAHLMAVSRYIDHGQALAKLKVFEDQPFGYEHFDWTPVYALMAYPWLAAGEQ